MSLFSFRTSLLVALAAATALTRGATSPRIAVAAEPRDRLGLVASFPLPRGTPQNHRLRDAEGRTYLLQVDSGTARFIIPEQRAGETLVLSLVEGEPAGEHVAVTRARGDLGINVVDRRTLVYQTDMTVLPRDDIDAKFMRAAYLHPVLSPSGAVVTGDYPSNHVHHHGIWTSWSKVQFQGRATNFWEMAEQKGTTRFLGIDRAWNGAVHGGFLVRQQMVDLSTPQPTPALDETWEVTTYHLTGITPAARVFDLVITQACATPDPVMFPKHLYGGLGFRGRDEWNGRENMVVLTSEGAATRETANTTRVRWCYVGGLTEGRAQAGIAILGHPGNFRTPEAIRVHPEMPFVSFAPVQLGDMSIEPGRPYVARYRFVVTDGAPERARLDAYWNAFARPAVVTVE